MKKWNRWQDWAAVAAGAAAALSPIWATHSTASLWMMIGLGVLIAASGIVNLAVPGTPWAEWVQVVLGAILVAGPWLGSYTGHTGASWTSWIAGAVVLVATAFAIRPSTEAHHHNPITSH